MEQIDRQVSRLDHLNLEIRSACRSHRVNWMRVLRLAEEIEVLSEQTGKPCPLDMALIRRRASV